MAVFYSGGTYVNSTFTGDTKANIIGSIQTALTAAGWTVVSGGGTTNLLMQSATQANVTHPIRVRFQDNAGSCVQIVIENQAGTLAGRMVISSSIQGGGNLLPASAKIFRIIAKRYDFYVMTPGASGSREFVMAGMLSVPPPLTGVTDCGYMFCNSFYDANTTTAYCLRTGSSITLRPGSTAAQTGSPNFNVLWNGNLWDNVNNGGQSPGYPELLVGRSAPTYYESSALYRWANDDEISSDTLVGWGLASATDEAKARGYLFDAVYRAQPYTADTEETIIDAGITHTFHNISHNNAGVNGGTARGGIWVAVS
ncbi:MAG: hypothetical protein NVSMB6_30570 [Burkholderiaceae bacterium]